MAQSTTETIGFCNQFIQLIQDNTTELKTKGLDVSSWIPLLTSQKDDIVAKDAEQDTAKAVAKTKTREANASRELCYKSASSKLDAVMGVLGKDTELAKQAARLRSSLNKSSKKKKTPPTNP
jgi:23S rRNA maturation mini-RNase III